MKTIKITNANIVAEGRLINGASLFIKDGIIEEVSASVIGAKADIEYNAERRYVLPGFIDIHTNGIAGFDCTFGKYNNQKNSFSFDEENYLSGLNNAVKKYLESGCTKVILSTISAPLEQVKQALEFIKKFKHENPFLNS